jgi:hypothetical protein
MIEAELSSKSKRLTSFWDVFETLKQHDFMIAAGVDSADVVAFVDWVELLEQSLA